MFRRRFRPGAFVVCCLLVSALFATGTCRAEEEKVLSMYVAYGGPEKIAEAFESATGIKVQFLTMSSGEVLTRLRAEKAHPMTDIWFGGGSDAFIQGGKEGLTEKYVSPNAKNIQPAFKDADGYWTGVSLVVVGFNVNTSRLDDKKLPIPASWADLTDAKYKDEVLASNPNTSGTAYTTVSGLLQIMGEKKGWEFLDKIYGNIPFLTKSGSAPGQKTLAGEFSAGIAPDPHILALQNPDAPLQSIMPTDGVLTWPSPVALIAGAKHPDNAKKFIDWCLSEEGQKVLMAASPRVPTTNVETLPGVPKLSELNLVTYDHLKWGAERERVIKQFNERFPQFQ